MNEEKREYLLIEVWDNRPLGVLAQSSSFDFLKGQKEAFEKAFFKECYIYVKCGGQDVGDE